MKLINLLTAVVSGKTSPDNIPDGYASGIDQAALGNFFWGFVVGIAATLLVVGLVKYFKWLMKSDEEKDQKKGEK